MVYESVFINVSLLERIEVVGIAASHLGLKVLDLEVLPDKFFLLKNSQWSLGAC